MAYLGTLQYLPTYSPPPRTSTPLHSTPLHTVKRLLLRITQSAPSSMPLVLSRLRATPSGTRQCPLCSARPFLPFFSPSLPWTRVRVRVRITESQSSCTAPSQGPRVLRHDDAAAPRSPLKNAPLKPRAPKARGQGPGEPELCLKER